MQNLAVIVIVCSFLCEGNGFGIPSFLEWGRCPNILPMKGLDLPKLDGTWFTQLSVPNDLTAAKTCLNNNFTWTGQEIAVALKGLNDDGEKVVQRSSLFLPEGQAGDRPVLLTRLRNAPEAPFVVYSTDYRNYMCVHSCLDFVGFRAQFFWFRTREPRPSEDWNEICTKELYQHGVTSTGTKRVYQGPICPYWNNKEYKHLHAYKKEVESNSILTQYQVPLMHIPYELRDRNCAETIRHTSLLLMLCLIWMIQ